MKQLIFVYNADSGIFNALNDFAHKIFSPSTYLCNLCKLTYGNFSMKKEWQAFIKQLPFKVVFLYADVFLQQYHFKAEAPAAFIKDAATLNLFITKQQIENCTTIEELEILITNQLAVNG